MAANASNDRTWDQPAWGVTSDGHSCVVPSRIARRLSLHAYTGILAAHECSLALQQPAAGWVKWPCDATAVVRVLGQGVRCALSVRRSIASNSLILVTTVTVIDSATFGLPTSKHCLLRCFRNSAQSWDWGFTFRLWAMWALQRGWWHTPQWGRLCTPRTVYVPFNPYFTIPRLFLLIAPSISKVPCPAGVALAVADTGSAYPGFVAGVALAGVAELTGVGLSRLRRWGGPDCSWHGVGLSRLRRWGGPELTRGRPIPASSDHRPIPASAGDGGVSPWDHTGHTVPKVESTVLVTTSWNIKT